MAELTYKLREMEAVIEELTEQIDLLTTELNKANQELGKTDSVDLLDLETKRSSEVDRLNDHIASLNERIEGMEAESKAMVHEFWQQQSCYKLATIVKREKLAIKRNMVAHWKVNYTQERAAQTQMTSEMVTALWHKISRMSDSAIEGEAGVQGWKQVVESHEARTAAAEDRVKYLEAEVANQKNVLEKREKEKLQFQTKIKQQEDAMSRLEEGTRMLKHQEDMIRAKEKELTRMREGEVEKILHAHAVTKEKEAVIEAQEKQIKTMMEEMRENSGSNHRAKAKALEARIETQAQELKKLVELEVKVKQHNAEVDLIKRELAKTQKKLESTQEEASHSEKYLTKKLESNEVSFREQEALLKKQEEELKAFKGGQIPGIPHGDKLQSIMKRSQQQEEQLTTQSRELKDLRLEVQDLERTKARLKSLERDLESREADCRKFKGLADEGEKAKKRLAVLETDYNKARDEVKRLLDCELELEKARKKMTMDKSEHEKVAKHVRTLELKMEEFDRLEKQYRGLQRVLEEKEEKLGYLSSDAKNKSSECEEYETRMRASMAQVSKMEDEVDRMKTELRRKQSEVDEVNSKNKQVSSKCDDLESEIVAITKRMRDAESGVSGMGSIEARLREAEDETAKYQNKYAELSREHEATTDKLSSKLKELDDVNRALESAQKQAKMAGVGPSPEQSQEIKAKLRKADDEMMTLQQDVRKLNNENEELTFKAQKMEQRLAEETKESTRLQEELRNLKSGKGQGGGVGTDELDRLQSKIQKLESENQKLKGGGGISGAKAERELEKAQQKIKALEEEERKRKLGLTTSDTVAPTSRELEQAERVMANLEREKARLTAENDSLKALLKENGIAWNLEKGSWSKPVEPSPKPTSNITLPGAKASFDLDAYASRLAPPKPKEEPSPEPGQHRGSLTIDTGKESSGPGGNWTPVPVTQLDPKQRVSAVAIDKLQGQLASLASEQSLVESNYNSTQSLEAKAAAFWGSPPPGKRASMRAERAERAFERESLERSRSDPGMPDGRGGYESMSRTASARAASPNAGMSILLEQRILEGSARSPHSSGAKAAMPRFEDLDRNGDGVIDRREYESGMASRASSQDYSPSRGSPSSMRGSPTRGYGSRGEIGSLAASLAELTAANQGALNGMNQQMKLMRQRGRGS